MNQFFVVVVVVIIAVVVIVKGMVSFESETMRQLIIDIENGNYPPTYLRLWRGGG